MKHKQIKKKIVLVTLVFLVVGVILLKSIVQTSIQIYDKQKEKKEFTAMLEELKEKEEQLNNTVTKLQDPDYVARYAREKYLYSKDGEIIIRIPD
ncbi:MAG: septum formation initiator family protein [Bacilli bacterium]|nr:septum formation initiator family protein [Bacilli bacterium]